MRCTYSRRILTIGVPFGHRRLEGGVRQKVAFPAGSANGVLDVGCEEETSPGS